MRRIPRLFPTGSPAWDAATDAEARLSGPAASIVLVTHNRLRMLERCVSTVLANTQDVDHELIVWDNASDDGTREYLDSVAARYERVRVAHSEANIGLNGVAAGVRLARGAYIVEMDDDILDVPPRWLADMIRAFESVPRAGYLAANVVQDESTNGAKPGPDQYRERRYRGGTVIEHGPTGGWCTITSRRVINRIGNFMEMPGRVFFCEDGDFGSRCRRNLLRVGIIRDVRVYHAAGLAKNAEFGYLDLCKAKYSEDSAFRPMLDGTLEAMARERAQGSQRSDDD